MRGALQPATVPPGFLEQVTQWAEGQPVPVSVFLFGSRARGDHGPGSDWDFALVHEGECPDLGGLPDVLEDEDVDWVPLERSRALRWLNLCGVQNAVASSGLCLVGEPLPKPERSDMNQPMAWHFLIMAHRKMHECASALRKYWSKSPHLQRERDSSAAGRSAEAAESLCKAALHLRGLEAKQSHSVNRLCRILERADPHDPLLHALKGCNGETKGAHEAMYAHRTEKHESIADSTRRLWLVTGAVDAVLMEACDLFDPTEHVFAPEDRDDLEYERNEFIAQVENLEAAPCPANDVRRLREGMAGWSGYGEVWHRLNMPARGKPQAHQHRGKAGARGR